MEFVCKGGEASRLRAQPFELFRKCQVLSLRESTSIEGAWLKQSEQSVQHKAKNAEPHRDSKEREINGIALVVTIPLRWRLASYVYVSDVRGYFSPLYRAWQFYTSFGGPWQSVLTVRTGKEYFP